IGYQEGFSILCPASKNFKNPSPPDKSVTVFAGTNKSGKTESGLKQRFVIQLLAQSLTFTSGAGGGNFRVHHRHVCLDRCSAAETYNLSAFGTDIVNMTTVQKHVGGARAAMICFDEGFATTGPSAENQPTLWLASVEGLRTGEN